MTNKSKQKHECKCCASFFPTKLLFKAHERKCVRMDIDNTISNSSSIRKRKLPSAVRFSLWNNTFGERVGFGTCYCCGREVTQQNFEAGHVQAKSKGGSDSLSNLRVLCRVCNNSMGSENLELFKTRYVF